MHVIHFPCQNKNYIHISTIFLVTHLSFNHRFNIQRKRRDQKATHMYWNLYLIFRLIKLSSVPSQIIPYLVWYSDHMLLTCDILNCDPTSSMNEQHKIKYHSPNQKQLYFRSHITLNITNRTIYIQYIFLICNTHQ